MVVSGNSGRILFDDVPLQKTGFSQPGHEPPLGSFDDLFESFCFEGLVADKFYFFYVDFFPFFNHESDIYPALFGMTEFCRNLCVVESLFFIKETDFFY